MRRTSSQGPHGSCGCGKYIEATESITEKHVVQFAGHLDEEKYLSAHEPAGVNRYLTYRVEPTRDLKPALDPIWGSGGFSPLLNGCAICMKREAHITRT